jgi:hypothetical protein
LQQRRNKEICKLPSLEDFEANVEVTDDKILYQLNYRSIMSHIHPPKALFIQIFMIPQQCGFKSAIYLFMLFFLSDHFYSVQ